MPEIKIKHAGTTHALDLPHGDCIYTRVGALLDLPPARLTIIRSGKKLPSRGDPALAAAVVPGVYLVSGTRTEDELPSTARRYFADATEAATALYSRLSWDFFVALLFWLWALLGSLGQASIAFVKSMVVAPDPARVDRRARPHAPPQDAAAVG